MAGYYELGGILARSFAVHHILDGSAGDELAILGTYCAYKGRVGRRRGKFFRAFEGEVKAMSADVGLADCIRKVAAENPSLDPDHLLELIWTRGPSPESQVACTVCGSAGNRPLNNCCMF